ncbi:MAG TPA: chemotaxis protein [Campylobacteraceae bacterium]|jgi:chemotaxis regulatin CheY-phosphate phosphatase CheZ|nr:chemotaxis protein [Campylobacteraceae bacterium]
MTQEELDALMAEGFDDDVAVMEEEESGEEPDNADAIGTMPETGAKEEENGETDAMVIDQSNYRVDAAQQWPPPPPTEDHKVVNQLDDVTKDSEKKATEIMDKLEEINNFIMDIEADGEETKRVLEENIETFGKLADKFPNIALFGEMVTENEKALGKLGDIVEKSQGSADEIMMIMDIMQYQDIHRQKIERVINVMRALSKYMNSLFESSVDDSARVSSAAHIAGDGDTEDVVSSDEIEALLASFGQH